MADARSVFLAVIKGDASQAVTEFDKLGKSVEKSTGKSTTAIGKFKTLGSAALSELGVNATTMAATAGAAFARFAYQAANEFAALAKSADDLSKATGLTIEQASRWMEVSGDLGVSTETLQVAIGRLNKNLSTDKFEKYGIATRDAAGNMLSSQEIFLNVLDAMNRTPDAGKRAKMGADLMGKGWQSLAPILGKSRAEYDAMLQSVLDGQVITDAEREKTRKFIEIQQELSDKFTNYKMAVGDSAISLLNFGNEVMKSVEKLTKLGKALNMPELGLLEESLKSLINPFYLSGEMADYFTGMFGAADDEVSSSTLAKDLSELGSTFIVGGINVLSDEIYRVADGAGVAATNVLDLKSYFVDLLRAIDEEKGLLSLQDTFDDVRSKALEAYVAAAEGSAEAEQKQRDYQMALLDLRRELLLYIGDVGDIPPEVGTEISAMIDEGKLDEAEAALNALARFREATIGVRTLIGGRMDDGGVSDFLFGQFDLPGRAVGGPVSGGSPYLVGERGPELFVPGMSGSIVPNHALGGGGVVLNVTVTNPVASGEQLANELAAYTRRYGSNWLVSA